jgi:hypothetical protein
MRHVASVFVLAAGLAACSSAQQVSSTPPSTSTAYNPPTVSYQIAGNDLTDANNQAASYCSRYSATARLQTNAAGRATYQCVGGTVPGTVVTAVPPGTVVAPAGTVVTNPSAVVLPQTIVAAPVVAAAPAGTVAYPVVGNDLTGSNQSAINYCRQMGRNASLAGVNGGTAYYNCI